MILRCLLRRLFSLELCDVGGALITGSLFLLESGQMLRCSSSLLQRRAGNKIHEDLRFDCPALAVLALSTSSAFLPAFAVGSVFVHARQLLYERLAPSLRNLVGVRDARTPASMHASSLWTISRESWCCLRRVARTSGVFASRCWLLVVFSRANFVPLAFMIVPLLK